MPLLFCWPISLIQRRALENMITTFRLCSVELKKTFLTDDTIVLDVRSSIFYGYRHLRGYKVFLADVRVNSRGETSGVASGMNGQTFIAEAINIAPSTRYIVCLMDPSDEKYKIELQRQNLRRLELEDDIGLYYQDLKPDL